MVTEGKKTKKPVETWLLDALRLKSWPEEGAFGQLQNGVGAAEAVVEIAGVMIWNSCSCKIHGQVCSTALPWIISWKDYAPVEPRLAFPNVLSWVGDTELMLDCKVRVSAEGFGCKMNVVFIRIFHRKHCLFMKNSLHLKCLQTICKIWGVSSITVSMKSNSVQRTDVFFWKISFK